MRNAISSSNKQKTAFYCIKCGHVHTFESVTFSRSSKITKAPPVKAVLSFEKEVTLYGVEHHPRI
nr:MAG TPA: protein of unknown function (DUF3973) [Caudoviricetes sp.]